MEEDIQGTGSSGPSFRPVGRWEFFCPLVSRRLPKGSGLLSDACVTRQLWRITQVVLVHVTVRGLLSLSPAFLAWTTVTDTVLAFSVSIGNDETGRHLWPDLRQAVPFFGIGKFHLLLFYPLMQNWTEMGPWPSMQEE